MTQDEELEALARDVCAIFGADVLAEAYVRALRATPSLTTVSDQVLELSPHVPVWFTSDLDAKVVDGRVLASAFRGELRRLLTRH